MKFGEVLAYQPYGLGAEEKDKLLTARLSELTELHRSRCPEYEQILDAFGYKPWNASDYCDIPFLPTRLFKQLELRSCEPDEVVKTMTSSGTTGQRVSKIYLNRSTASNQQRAMARIVSEFIGHKRVPMVIVDCPSVVRNRAMFSARGAGILGFSLFGSKRIYALNDDMTLNVEDLSCFLDTHSDEHVLFFGFTFMIWQYFYRELARLQAEGTTIDLSNATLIHGGGWKRLASEAVGHEEFRARLGDVCGLSDIHDYYGMVEQTGCIYMECECGHLHASTYSDVIVRRPVDFSVCEVGESGIVQVVSTIPESYPGHSLLTEDVGVIDGIDDCPCGRKGKYFRILGRLERAELRGCSDTYAAEH